MYNFKFFYYNFFFTFISTEECIINFVLLKNLVLKLFLVVAIWTLLYQAFMDLVVQLLIRHFTGTLVVTSHKINACSVFAPWCVSALYGISAVPRPCDQLDAKDPTVHECTSKLLKHQLIFCQFIHIM